MQGRFLAFEDRLQNKSPNPEDCLLFVSVCGILFTEKSSVWKEGLMMFAGIVQMSVFWLIAMIVLLVIEAAVPGLISIWFALGSLAALISAMFHAPVWLQLVWFFLVSILTLVLTRPLVKKYVNGKTMPTNADMGIGKDAVVTEKIDNLHARGAVLLDGKVWTARMATENESADVGDTVRVLRIEGVKLIVEKKKPEA